MPARPSARKKRRIRLGDLAGHDIVHLAKSSSVRQYVDILLREVAAVHSGFEVEHLATVAGLVVTRKDETLSTAAQGMLELIGRQIGPLR